jgi:hypothetical protein
MDLAPYWLSQTKRMRVWHSSPWPPAPCVRGPGGLQVVPEPRAAGQEFVEFEQDADVEGMELDDVAAHGLGLDRDPDAVLFGAFLDAGQGRDLGRHDPAGRSPGPAQPPGHRMVGRGRGENLQVGVGADRRGEVGQVPFGQLRIAETGPEREQFGGGSHGFGVIQGGQAHLAQFGP